VFTVLFIVLFVINLLLYCIQLYTLRFIVYYLLCIYVNVIIEVKRFNFEILFIAFNKIKISKIILNL